LFGAASERIPNLMALTARLGAVPFPNPFVRRPVPTSSLVL
jgi:hypothetical protein